MCRYLSTRAKRQENSQARDKFLFVSGLTFGWCRIEDFEWLFVTTLEDMHFCKPHIQYYQEIVDYLGLDPERCVMIGNDVQEDMVAGKLGMKTVLVEDYCIDRNTGNVASGLVPHMRGLLKDVPAITQSIKGKLDS